MPDLYIPVITKKEAAKVKVSDIILVERIQRKLHIVTADKQYDYYEKLENIETMLDDRFYPCLKGCYINLDRIVSMAEQTIYFDNGYVYNLGRGNFIKIKQVYKVFLKNTVQI